MLAEDNLPSPMDLIVILIVINGTVSLICFNVKPDFK